MTKAFDVSKFRKGITKSIAGISTGFNDPTDWLSTGSYGLNYLISGDFYKGVPMGKVTVFAGESGCLPASAKVRLADETITVGQLKERFAQGPVEISTPDGYQTITEWFDKGTLPMVSVTTASGLTTRCATNHMLQRDTGEWVYAEHVSVGDHLNTLNDDADPVTSVTQEPPEECYDFTIDHENHRYWGDGFSSHNSGKSFIVSGNIIKSAQEQGFFTVLIDTESALDEQWLMNLGVDTSEDKILRISASMIDDVAKIISDFVKEYKDNYYSHPKEERPKVLFVIDSVGMLLTATDVNQFNAGDMKGDMGRKAKQLKTLVTNCVNMFGDLNIGMVVTNHTYASQDMFDPDDKISGGCLIAGSGVKTDRGIVPIESITAGDVVHTLEGLKPVSETFQYNKEAFELELEDGTVITATGEHRFMVRDETGYVWKTVDQLEAGDEILKCESKQ